MVVADNLSTRADADMKFLFLLWLEEAHVPIPDVEFRRHHPVGLLQAQLAFEVRLGVVVHIKNNGRLVAADILSEAARKSLRACERFVSRDAKVHRRFREGSEKIVAVAEHAPP